MCWAESGLAFDEFALLTDDSAAAAPREPFFNMPAAVTAIVALLAAIHLVRTALPIELDDWVVWAFGFVPLRFETSMLGPPIPGGWGALIWSFVTYALLHADLTHLGFNILWLLPFGAAVARRFGASRFFVFMAICAVGGALAHLLTHSGERAPMIGASAAISGAMAAAARFAFERGSFLGFRRSDGAAAALVPALPLSASLRNPRVISFVAIWFGMNTLFGLGSISLTGEPQSVAWQAHIGGFLVGLLLFSLFDPVPKGCVDVPSDTNQQ
jgi:membrane associated rhomboid family serine protease